MKERYKNIIRIGAIAGLIGVGSEGMNIINPSTRSSPAKYSSSLQKLDYVQSQIDLAEQDLGKKPIIVTQVIDIFRHPDPQSAEQDIERAIQVFPDIPGSNFAINSVAIDLSIMDNIFYSDLHPQQATTYTGSGMYGIQQTNTYDWSDEETWLEITTNDIEMAEDAYPTIKSSKKNQ